MVFGSHIAVCRDCCYLLLAAELVFCNDIKLPLCVHNRLDVSCVIHGQDTAVFTLPGYLVALSRLHKRFRINLADIVSAPYIRRIVGSGSLGHDQAIGFRSLIHDDLIIAEVYRNLACICSCSGGRVLCSYGHGSAAGMSILIVILCFCNHIRNPGILIDADAAVCIHSHNIRIGSFPYRSNIQAAFIGNVCFQLNLIISGPMGLHTVGAGIICVHHVKGFLVGLQYRFIVTEVDGYLIAVGCGLAIHGFGCGYHAAYAAVCLAGGNHVIPQALDWHQISVLVYLTVVLDVSGKLIYSIVRFDALAGICGVGKLCDTIGPFSGSRIVNAIVTLSCHNTECDLAILYGSLCGIVSIFRCGSSDHIRGCLVSFRQRGNGCCVHINAVITEVHGYRNLGNGRAVCGLCLYLYGYASAVSALAVCHDVLNPLCSRLGGNALGVLVVGI